MRSLATAFVPHLLAFHLAAATEPSSSPWRFEEIGEVSGLRFEYRSGAAGELSLTEIMGGGAALLDYDRDGDLDLYLVQGAAVPRGESTGDRLLRNDLAAPGTSLRFVDVSAEMGIVEDGVGMGVATGDYDNDGWVDVYVTNLGEDSLLHNESGTGFRDVTELAGVHAPGWGVASTFLDFDRDGWLDLFVVGYVVHDRETTCFAQNTRRDYCGPSSYPSATSQLLRNRGDGTFAPFAEATFAALAGPGLGVVTIDADEDRYLDLLVANDGRPNHLWRNLGGRGFREEGRLAGIAVNRYGLSEAGMGIAVGDVDGDGDEDAFLSHLTGETNTLYLRDGPALYEDATLRSGLGPPSLPATGFGTAFLDFEGDGDLDLLVVNGAVRHEHGREIEASSHDSSRASGPGALREPTTANLGQANLAFVNEGGGRFTDATSSMPASFRLPETSRGLALGDIDGDRALDFVVIQVDAPARLYRGVSRGAVHALGWNVLERHGRDALGARVTWEAGGTRVSRVVRTEGSYASASDPRIVLSAPALGGKVDALRVDWPDGTSESWTGAGLQALVEAARTSYATLRQGESAR